MPSLLQEFLGNKKVRRLTDVRNIALYLFTIFILAITWSGVKTVQTNYELQKKIAKLEQQNEVIKLENDTIALQNQYYKTNQFLELAARQNLGLAAPGETVLLVPESVAKKYIDKSLAVDKPTVRSSQPKKSAVVGNLEAWRDFIFGQKVTSD